MKLGQSAPRKTRGDHSHETESSGKRAKDPPQGPIATEEMGPLPSNHTFEIRYNEIGKD